MNICEGVLDLSKLETGNTEILLKGEHPVTLSCKLIVTRCEEWIAPALKEVDKKSLNRRPSLMEMLSPRKPKDDEDFGNCSPLKVKLSDLLTITAKINDRNHF